MENKREIFQVFARRFGLLYKDCCDCRTNDISLVQSQIIYEIKRQNNPSMQQIAESIGMDITTFSRQIQTLVLKQLVKKTPDPNDKRINVLSLTKEGEELEVIINARMNEYLDDIFSHLSKEDQDMVLRSIMQLNEAMLKTKSCCLPPI